MVKKSPKKGILKLPVQRLNWSQVPAKTQKIFFQFDISVAGNGNKKFGFVAYAAQWKAKRWHIIKKIAVTNVPGKKRIELPIPITLGNLELKFKALKKWGLTFDSHLTLTPKMYKANPHAALSVSDGTSTEMANPCPPARPEEA